MLLVIAGVSFATVFIINNTGPAPWFAGVAQAFNGDFAYEHVEALAEMDGRGIGQHGGARAAAYIAEKFAAYGLEPGGKRDSYIPVLPLDKTVAMLQLDAVGGGSGYYLEAHGEWEQDGLLLFSMMATEDLIDGRLALRGQSGESAQALFHETGLPTLLVAWRGASEDNWPVEIADEVDPYRLGVTGRMVSLALMSLAR